MRTVARITVAAAAAGGALLIASPAVAQQACPPGQVASGSAVVVCSETPGTLPDQQGGLPDQKGVLGTGAEKSAGGGAGVGSVTSARTSPATLPFTGDEILVMSVLGASALALGAGLVVAGRRRTLDTA